MASTNKTSHYELSQYVGTDKPTYLTDYNNDMSAIDTGIYNAQTKANDGYTLANTADGKADQALTNAGSAQTDASTALTRIGTLANLTTTEKTNIVGAVNEVDSDITTLTNKFDLTVFNSYGWSDLSKTNISNGDVTISVASNSDGSIAKIYGNGWFALTNSSANSKLSFQSVLRPSSDITINGSVIALGNNTGGTGGQIKIYTTGIIEIECYYTTNDTAFNIIVPPCVYFIKDFGDTDTN